MSGELKHRKGKKMLAKERKNRPMDPEPLSPEKRFEKGSETGVLLDPKANLSQLRIKLYSIDLSRFDTANLFIILSFAHIFCSVIFAFLQEKVNLIEGFHYPQFMTVVQTSTYAMCAFVEMMLSRGDLGSPFAPKAPKSHYFMLSLLTVGGMYFTNSGLAYLSYPTRIIFKAAKPVPTMILEWCYVGKTFTLMEVLSVGVLTFGITLFCSGEARGAPSFHLAGVGFMILGVTFDALTSNFEKKHIFNYNASHAEAMFFASLLGTVWSGLTLAIHDTDMLFEAVSFVMATPSALGWLFLSSLGGYFSVTFILLLIKLYSTTYAECVKGLRKVVSILISYLLLGKDKSFGSLHAAGMACFVASIGATIYEKSEKENNKTEKPKYAKISNRDDGADDEKATK